MASNIAAIVARFPLRELEIRRKCAQDQRFAEVCEDYSEALEALQRWEKAGAAGATQVEDYHRMVGELEAEVVSKLGRQ